MSGDLRCKHCGERIIRHDFLGREDYTHQPVGASFLDSTHRYCHLTAAEPADPEPPKGT